MSYRSVTFSMGRQNFKKNISSSPVKVAVFGQKSTYNLEFLNSEANTTSGHRFKGKGASWSCNC